MKKRFPKPLALFMTVILAVSFLPRTVLAAVPDRPSNQYVLDSASVISSTTEDEIVSKNKTLFQETGAEIVVAAVDFLNGESIDDYAYDLFSAWGIGSAERNNGLLLVMAVAEDDYYALPGYGVEDFFSGSHLQDILDQYVEPSFAQGDYDKAALEFFNAAYAELRDFDYNDGYGEAEDFDQGGNYENYDDYNEDGWSGPAALASSLFWVVIRIVIAVVVVVLILCVVRAITRGGGGPRGGSGGGGGFWAGMFLGNMLGNSRHRHRSAPPPPPGGFGGSHPPRNGSGGGAGGHSGGFHSGGGASRGSGSFHGGGGSRGGGAGRR